MGADVLPRAIFDGLEYFKKALVAGGVRMAEDHEHSASFNFLTSTGPLVNVLMSLHPSGRVHVFSRKQNVAGSVENMLGQPWCCQFMFTREDLPVGLPEMAGFAATMSAHQFAVFLLRSLVNAWEDRFPNDPFPLRGRPMSLGGGDPLLPETLRQPTLPA